MHLCGSPAPRRAGAREPVRLAPDGVWRAAVSPRSLVGSYPTVSPLPAASPEMRRRRSVFCATVRRLSPPPSRERPALRCPDFPRAPEGPRSPGLRPEFYLDNRGTEAPVEDGVAFRAADGGALVQDELPAHRAFERRPAQQREELLLQRPVQGRHAHSSRNTPTTLPRICTCAA